MEHENGISKAVRLAGNQTKLAVGVGVSPQAVQKWEKQGYVPSERCKKVEEFLGRRVTRYELNPDVFGSPDDALLAPTDGLPAEQPERVTL